ncbi:MAG: alpha/beta fold hydrolase [Candidatus Helarchaeota archaeon]
MYLEVEDNVKVYYEDNGPRDGFPLVLIHGWGVSSALWSEQVAFLTDHGYRTIAMDSRGHGKSDYYKYSKDTDLLKTIINDLQILLSHLEINKPFGIIGHSAGGGIGISIYLSNPDNVAFLCILNSSYILYERIDERIIWSLVPNLINLGYNPILRGPYRYLIRKLIHIIAVILNRPIEKVKIWVEDILNINKDVLIRELYHLKKYNLKEDLKKINIPCLIIAGEYDWLAPPLRSKILHKYINNSELHIIKGTGHLSKIEKSGIVNNLILDFIKRVENNEF